MTAQRPDQVRGLRRPRRIPPGPRLVTALAMIALWLVWLGGRPAPAAGSGAIATGSASRSSAPAPGAAPAKLPEPPGLGNRVTSFPSSPALISQGMTLYEGSCSACHGSLLEGRPGQGPSLDGVGAGPVDFYLSTGRMPLQNPTDEPTRGTPLYNRAQIDALIAFVTSVGGGPSAPGADPAAGDLALGLHVFTLDCAGCHQIVGRGGLTIGAYVPELQRATPQQLAEAIRMGPYLMPHFGSAQIDQHQLDSLARYVQWTRHPDDAGGWGIGNLGPIPEGMVAWFMLLLALVIVARLIGERTA